MSATNTYSPNPAPYDFMERFRAQQAQTQAESQQLTDGIQQDAEQGYMRARRQRDSDEAMIANLPASRATNRLAGAGMLGQQSPQSVHALAHPLAQYFMAGGAGADPASAWHQHLASLLYEGGLGGYGWPTRNNQGANE